MDDLAELLGDSPAIQVVRDTLHRLLDRQQAGQRLPPILLQGETGTGKGLIARLLHRHGARRHAPLVDVNCAAIPETLLEAELFGFERGAFTDAHRAKPGLFHAAHGGVLFLDEVSLLPDSAQAKLLTAIEERAVRRLGGTRREPADIWVISASNADLRSAVGARRFREDLYHRLAVVTVELPPLRERGRDILLLAERFLARTCAEYGLQPKCLDRGTHSRLLEYAWPGNIRELGNVMERAVLLGDTPVVTADNLGPLQLNGVGAAAPESPTRTATTRDEAQRQQLMTALEQTGWNISLTAARLGIARNTVYARLERYRLRAEPPQTATASPLPPLAAAAAPSGDIRLQWDRRSLALLRAELCSADAVDAWSQASRALDGIIAKVHNFGGRVEEVTLGGLVAVFGLEPAEDAVRRAAHAAMAIHKEVQRAWASNGRRPEVTIGLHVEPLLIGWAGGRIEIDASAKRAQWPVLDRLLHSSRPGDTIASGAAMPFLERRFELSRMEAGEGQEAVYRLTGQERRGLGLWGSMARFVGRGEEFNVLRSRLSLAEGGRGQVMAVVGDAGVGKSRLIYELAAAQRLPGWRVLEGAAVSYGQAMSYLPVITILKSYIGIQDADNARAVGEKVTEKLLTLDAALEPMLPAVLALLDVPVEDKAWRSLEPAERRQRTLEAVRRVLLREARERPLLLIFEDLHWIDSETRAVLDVFVEALGTARVALLVSYRPGYQHTWSAKTSYTELRLDVLSAEQAREFLDTLLGTDPGLAAMKQLLVKRGNPFFLEETVRTLVERGALEGPHGGYRLAHPVPTLEIPPTVEAVLAARIDRLAPADRGLLQTAAVIGKRVPVALLQAIAQLDDPALRAGLTRLHAAEFLYETSLFPELEYTFKHALTHEVAYGSLLVERRRALHAQVVETIEARFADRLPQHVELLAHHAFRGEVWDKALLYVRQAGHKAALLSAHREAAACFEQALTALDHLADGREAREAAIDLRLELRGSLFTLGELSRIPVILGEAEVIATAIGDRGRQGLALLTLSNHYFQMADFARAGDYAERALAIARELGDPGIEAMATLRLGGILSSVGEFRRAIDLLGRAVPGLQEHPLEHLHLESGGLACLCLLARAHIEVGEFVPAMDRAKEAIQIGEAADAAFHLVHGHFALGLAHLRKGDLERAVPTLERGLGIARARSVSFMEPFLCSAVGSSYVQSGRIAEGISLLELGLSGATRMGIKSMVIGLRGWLAAGYLLAERQTDAATLALESLEAARQVGLTPREADARSMLGHIAASAQPPQIEEAEAHYRAALALADELGMRPLGAHCHLGLAKLYRTDNPEFAKQHLATATAMYRAMDMQFWLEQALWETKRSAS